MKWMSTAYGNKITFDESGNVSGKIMIQDIAHHLAGINRYAGAIISVKKPFEPAFYSVAEHSVLISTQVSKKAKLYALMHDAAEAYIGDIIRPIKTDDQRLIENKLMDMIIKQFGITVTDEIKKEVKHADVCMLASEFSYFKRTHEKEFLEENGLTEKDRLPVFIQELDPANAKRQFLGQFRYLCNPYRI